MKVPGGRKLDIRMMVYLELLIFFISWSDVFLRLNCKVRYLRGNACRAEMVLALNVGWMIMIAL